MIPISGDITSKQLGISEKDQVRYKTTTKLQAYERTLNKLHKTLKSDKSKISLSLPL